MDYRLLVDLEVIAVLDSIPKKARSRFLEHFIKLRSTPEQCSDCCEHDVTGRRIEISLLVADEEGLLLDHREIRHGADQHAGLGLAVETVFPVAIDRSFLVEGAVIDAVDLRALFGELGLQPDVQRLHLRFFIIAAGNAGLVGDDEDPPVAVVEFADGFGGALHPFEILDAIDVDLAGRDECPDVVNLALQPALVVSGNSGFDHWFQAQGPRDAQGRSLRELDLNTRLFRYPLSYMIYSAGFDGLPGYAKEYVYGRLRDVLSGRDRIGSYGRLSDADRATVLEILTATKPAFVAAAQIATSPAG